MGFRGPKPRTLEDTAPVMDAACDQTGGWYACWNWQRHVTNKGYGRIWAGGRQTWAHRVAYEMAYGPIPDGLLVRHSCDNPACVNPNHLATGTHYDNIMDMMRRDRKPGALTVAQVKEIRRRYAAGGVTQRQLAREYGVHAPAINRVVHRVRHKEVA